jgi:hypothetical protein
MVLRAGTASVHFLPLDIGQIQLTGLSFLYDMRCNAGLFKRLICHLTASVRMID